jgi:hypothetical protein
MGMTHLKHLCSFATQTDKSVWAPVSVTRYCSSILTKIFEKITEISVKFAHSTFLYENQFLNVDRQAGRQNFQNQEAHSFANNILEGALTLKVPYREQEGGMIRTKSFDIDHKIERANLPIQVQRNSLASGH